MLDLTWYKIFIGIFALFLLHHLLFAVLYFCGGPASYTEFGTRWDFQFFLNCFFFSIQAGQTIGVSRRERCDGGIADSAIVGLACLFSHLWTRLI